MFTTLNYFKLLLNSFILCTKRSQKKLHSFGTFSIGPELEQDICGLKIQISL